MNCLFSKPLREKLELMGTKVQNQGGGEIVFYLSCSLFSPSPDSVASNQSRLLSSSFLRHSPTPVVSISVYCQSPPVWKGSAGDVSKTDYFTLKQTSFS